MARPREAGITVLLLLGLSGCAGVQQRADWSMPSALEAGQERPGSRLLGRLAWWRRPRAEVASPVSATAESIDARPSGAPGGELASAADIWSTPRDGRLRSLPLLGWRLSGRGGNPQPVSIRPELRPTSVDDRADTTRTAIAARAPEDRAVRTVDAPGDSSAEPNTVDTPEQPGPGAANPRLNGPLSSPGGRYRAPEPLLGEVGADGSNNPVLRTRLPLGQVDAAAAPAVAAIDVGSPAAPIAPATEHPETLGTGSTPRGQLEANSSPPQDASADAGADQVPPAPAPSRRTTSPAAGTPDQPPPAPPSRPTLTPAPGATDQPPPSQPSGTTTPPSTDTAPEATAPAAAPAQPPAEPTEPPAAGRPAPGAAPSPARTTAIGWGYFGASAQGGYYASPPPVAPPQPRCCLLSRLCPFKKHQVLPSPQHAGAGHPSCGEPCDGHGCKAAPKDCGSSCTPKDCSSSCTPKDCSSSCTPAPTVKFKKPCCLKTWLHKVTCPGHGCGCCDGGCNMTHQPAAIAHECPMSSPQR
jgi:hypothetical protein